MAPDAPGWLTMTIVWPSCFSISAAATRVTWSVEPPAAHGTMRLIGRVGFHCAIAGVARANAATAGAVAGVNWRLRLVLSPVLFTKRLIVPLSWQLARRVNA